MLTEKKVLIVDDEQIVRRNLKRILNDEGYSVNTAKDGHNALELMDSDRYDLVVTDMKMPRMSGIEVLRKVKDSFPGVNVMIVTGYATVDTALEAMKSGACDYIEKPVSTEQFAQAVGRVFEKAGASDLPAVEVEPEVKPEEILPIDYSDETAEEWKNVLAGFRRAVSEGRISYNMTQGWTYKEMQEELVHLLTDEIQRKMEENGFSVGDVSRYRPTMETLLGMVAGGNLKVLLERWVDSFWNTRIGLNVERKYFEPLFLVQGLKHGAAERKLKAFEREIYRGNLCAAREWDLGDVMNAFNDYDRLFRGGCFGRRKCHMEGISVCKLGFDEINSCC